MTPEQTYTIGELAQAAEVTPRTIRYYVAEELLPPPEGGGRAAVYSREHLARLQLIKVLKDEFLPLQEIRTLLNGLNDAAVVDLLQQKQHSPKPPPAPGSAKQYLQMLLYPATPPDEGAGFMRHRVQAKKAAPGEMGAAPPPPPAPPAPAPAARQRGLGPAAGAGETAHQVKDPGPQNTLAVGRAEEVSPPTRWQRIKIRPGLELHVMDDPENQEFWPKIKQLLMVARQIFK